MEYHVKPWAHQLEAIDKSKSIKDMALFWEMGTGKTATTVNILRHKYQEAGGVLRTLILSPIVVLENWKEEFIRHAQLAPNNILVLDGSGHKKTDQIMSAIGEGKIIIANYEVMQNEKILAALFKFSPEIMVCDESQRLKSTSSKRAKNVYELSKVCRWRYLLSGTPILNTPMDIFQQFKILDGGETFGSNFFAFRATFFEDKNVFMPKHKHFPDWRPKPGAIDGIAQLIARKALRATKEQCLDLPPFVRENLYVEMGTDQKRAYKEMKNDFIAFIKAKEEGGESRAAIANLAITKALRLQQIVSGFVTTDDGTLVQFEDVPRLKALSELLEDLCVDNKVIIWAVFKENYKAIRAVCEEFKLKYVELHGEVKDKQKNIEAFRQDKDVKVIIANPMSAGLGVNLIEASYSVYFSKSFSLEQDIQSEARNHRGGSEIHKKITRIDLICKDTIDEQVTTALAKKENVAEHILDWKL
jgi:SNF2 family DNA or RNA helicase